MLKSKILIIVLTASFFFSGMDVLLAQDLPVSTPSEQGMDPEKIQEAVGRPASYLRKTGSKPNQKGHEIKLISYSEKKAIR